MKTKRSFEFQNFKTNILKSHLFIYLEFPLNSNFEVKVCFFFILFQPKNLLFAFFSFTLHVNKTIIIINIIFCLSLGSQILKASELSLSEKAKEGSKIGTSMVVKKQSSQGLVTLAKHIPNKTHKTYV